MTDAAPSPATPMTKGMYLECALQLIAERQGMDAAKALAAEIGVDPMPSPMRSYPLKDLSRLVFCARDKFWPDESDEALAERFGAYAFGTFAQSLIGRVGLNLTLNGDPSHVAQSVANMQNATARDGRCEVAGVGEGSFTLRYKGPINPHYTLGLMKVGFEVGTGGKVQLSEIRRFSLDENYLADADFDLTVTLGA